MSNEMTEQEQVIFNNVYLPAFVEKCASFGINFNSQENLNDALETAALVKQTLQSQNSDVIKTANLNLKKTLGLVEDSKPAAVKTASTQSPEVRKAMFEKLSKNAS